jgi:hypothetical protein
VARIEWLTYDHFAGRTGEPFDVAVGAEPDVTMILVEATLGSDLGGLGPEGQERRQFSLVFRGPATQVLPQRTYGITHEELGELELFLVPLGPDAEGMRYEAAFA